MLGVSHPLVATLAELQTDLGRGPSTQVLREQRPLIISELATETRWPAFTARALGLGVAAMLCLPLRANGRAVGTLTLYAPTADAFTRGDANIASVFTTHAARALSDAGEREDVARALADREVIGQATGLLMHRQHLSAEQAVDRLVAASGDANLTLADIATRLIAAEDRPSRQEGAVMSNLVWLRMLPGGAPRVLELGGEIDLHTAGELRGPLQALPGVDVIADLSRLRFLGAAGLTLLLQTRDQLAATGHTLHLACPAPTVRRLINLFDLAEALPCWPTVAQARVAAERRHDSSDATWTGSI